MEDEKLVATNDGENIAEEEQPTEEQPIEEQNQALSVGEDEETDDLPKKKGIKGIIEYIKAHENLRQPILFFLFSMICGGSQMLITLLFTQLYRVGGVLGEPFPGFYVGSVPLFAYASHAEFIGFLLGSVIGQVLTFVLNRKKTFNIHDHVAFRAIAYAFMAVAIIFVQTLLGGAVTVACRNAYSGGVAFVNDVIFNLIGQMVGGISALVISFLCNKFFIMRKFKGSHDTASAEEPAQTKEENKAE